MRDERLWIRLARKRALTRRLERYNAAALPLVKAEDAKKEMENLSREIFELDHEDEIEEVEKMARARRAEPRAPRLPVKRAWKPTPAKRRKRR